MGVSLWRYHVTHCHLDKLLVRTIRCMVMAVLCLGRRTILRECSDTVTRMMSTRWRQRSTLINVALQNVLKHRDILWYMWMSKFLFLSVQRNETETEQFWNCSVFFSFRYADSFSRRLKEAIELSVPLLYSEIGIISYGSQRLNWYTDKIDTKPKIKDPI